MDNAEGQNKSFFSPAEIIWLQSFYMDANHMFNKPIITYTLDWQWLLSHHLGRFENVALLITLNKIVTI